MTTPLDTLGDLLAADMNAVNAMILNHLGSDVPLAQTIAAGLIAAGGKRIRPLLTLAFGRIFDADPVNTQRMAAGIEFIHSATLLHDDVVDASELRRGKPTANATFGDAAPVLVGDFLFARAFEIMVQTGSLEALEMVAQTSSGLAQGEVLQLAVKGDLKAGVATYDKIIEAKTALLFAAATESAAIVGSGNREAARAYGLHLGMAFQIMDDVLDYAAAQPKLGKTLGDDFREGKMTLPVWLALEEASVEEHAFWIRTMGEQIQTDADLPRAMDILNRHDAFNRAREAAYAHADKAKAALGSLPGGKLRAPLTDLLDFVVEREN